MQLPCGAVVSVIYQNQSAQSYNKGSPKPVKAENQQEHDNGSGSGHAQWPVKVVTRMRTLWK